MVTSAESLVREEREKLTGFLHHLKEIERRKLYASYKYASLFKMTTQHFGYSEDEAYRRISAMKLLKEIPEVEEKLNQGKLTLTHLSLAQKHFRQEKKIQSRELPLGQKLSVIEQISETSVREAEKITLALSSDPEPVKPDRVRAVSEDQVEMKFWASAKTQEKIQVLKGLLAHKYPDMSLGELLDVLCDMGLEALDPANKPSRNKSQGHQNRHSNEQNRHSSDQTKDQVKTAAPKKNCVKKSKAQMRREVFLRAQNKCENCGSGFALEIDHVRPRALGGDDSPENLRLLCRACNQRAAIQIFGVEKMSRYLNSRGGAI